MIPATLPQTKLRQTPEPLKMLPRPTKTLRGPQIWINRDDLIGMGLGGSMVHKLEFPAGEALAKGAVHLMTQGVVEHRVDTNDNAYVNSGTVLLDRLLGCSLE